MDFLMRLKRKSPNVAVDAMTATILDNHACNAHEAETGDNLRRLLGKALLEYEVLQFEIHFAFRTRIDGDSPLDCCFACSEVPRQQTPTTDQGKSLAAWLPQRPCTTVHSHSKSYES